MPLLSPIVDEVVRSQILTAIVITFFSRQQQSITSRSSPLSSCTTPRWRRRTAPGHPADSNCPTSLLAPWAAFASPGFRPRLRPVFKSRPLKLVHFLSIPKFRAVSKKSDFVLTVRLAPPDRLSPMRLPRAQPRPRGEAGGHVLNSCILSAQFLQFALSIFSTYV